MTWVIKNTNTGKEREVESRAEAEETRDNLISIGASPDQLEIVPPKASDGGTESKQPEVVEDTQPAPEPPENETVAVQEQPGTEALDELGESLDTDPLSILPPYMITHVDGQPSLNKRGVSVLAYHYGVSVTDRETVAYPHETDYTSAIVEITVENEDGRVFVGSGEAHSDETPKHQLLRMAETRAYKRAVIFATGTGIVGYQEIMEELQ